MKNKTKQNKQTSGKNKYSEDRERETMGKKNQQTTLKQGKHSEELKNLKHQGNNTACGLCRNV